MINDKLICKKGHILEGDNLIIRPFGKYGKTCNLCRTCISNANKVKYRETHPIKVRGPKPKTHCKRGHELTGENAVQLFNKNGTKSGRKCMECNRLLHRDSYHRNVDSRKERVKLRYKNNPDLIRDYRLKVKYGITLEDHTKMLEEQDGKCYLCGTNDPGGKHKIFSVDHCHTTGKVRKLLCNLCNLALGASRDNPELLRKMADYIESYQKCNVPPDGWECSRNKGHNGPCTASPIT